MLGSNPFMDRPHAHIRRCNVYKRVLYNHFSAIQPVILTFDNIFNSLSNKKENLCHIHKSFLES